MTPFGIGTVGFNFNTLTSTRGNKYKLQKSASHSHYNLRKYMEQLTDSVVDADTLNTFKSRLDKHWLDRDVLYNFHSRLTGTGVVCNVVKDTGKHAPIYSHWIDEFRSVRTVDGIGIKSGAVGYISRNLYLYLFGVKRFTWAL